MSKKTEKIKEPKQKPVKSPEPPVKEPPAPGFDYDSLPVKIKKGTVVAYFNKTKPATNDNMVYCPHFMMLKPFNGCNYDCQWCYLLGTMGRYLEKGDFRDPRKPSYKNERMIAQDLTQALELITEPTMFNVGELADGQLYPWLLLNTVIPLFRDTGEIIRPAVDASDSPVKNKGIERKGTNPHGHKLLILTKDTTTRVMSQANATDQIVFSYSINATHVARRWELRAPDPIDRLVASRKAIDYGYNTRLRLDPMVPVKNWKHAYRDIIEKIMEFNPWADVITLGSVRGLQSTINVAKKLRKDCSWMNYLESYSNWGMKVPDQDRIDMYTFAIEEFERLGYQGEISLCKETLGIWKALKEAGVIDYGPGDKKCNCIR